MKLIVVIEDDDGPSLAPITLSSDYDNDDDGDLLENDDENGRRWSKSRSPSCPVPLRSMRPVDNANTRPKSSSAGVTTWAPWKTRGPSLAPPPPPPEVSTLLLGREDNNEDDDAGSGHYRTHRRLSLVRS